MSLVHALVFGFVAGGVLAWASVLVAEHVGDWFMVVGWTLCGLLGLFLSNFVEER